MKLPDGWGDLAAEDDDWWYVVRPMIFNWRLVKVPKDSPYECTPGFCYFGRGEVTRQRATAAAILWAEEKTPEPYDWDKNVATGEIRQ